MRIPGSSKNERRANVVVTVLGIAMAATIATFGPLVHTSAQGASEVHKKREAPVPSFVYFAEVERVVDGDTVDVELHLGLSVFADERLRLIGIDTPEITGKEKPEGLKSKARVDELLPVGSIVVVEIPNGKRGKFGRPLAIIWVKDINLNELLLVEKLAEPYNP